MKLSNVFCPFWILKWVLTAAFILYCCLELPIMNAGVNVYAPICASVNMCLWIGVTSLIVLETDTECCDVPPRSPFINEGLIVTIAWGCCWKMVLKSQPSLGISKMQEGHDGWSPHSVTDQRQGVRDQTPHPNLEHLWSTIQLQLPRESGWCPPWNRTEAQLLPPPNPGFVPSLLQLIGPKRSP